PSSVEGPLNGVTVIDLTRVLAGPFCTMVLADLGARIVKVEMPGTGDDSRQYGPFVNGKSAYYMSLNRGKESIALNLKSEADREVFDALLAHADVLIENYRPGTMAKLGYGWATLHERHPRLIYAAASGFGQTGPYAQRPAYDVIVQAMGGVMSMTGHPGMPAARVGTSVGDITAGLFSSIGINAALYNRTMTNEGMYLDISMLDCQVAICENAIARYHATGNVPGPAGSRNPSITPFESYATKDDFIVIAAGNDALFAKLAETIGRPQLADDPRFDSNTTRTTNAAVLKEEMEAALAARSRDEWIRIFDEAGIPCGPINNIRDVVEDVQVNERTMIVAAEDAVAGTVKMPGNPIKMSRYADRKTRAPSPELNEHHATLRDELGLA
ncbi:MAG: CoA transferase, partial [Proteobacteria bacterium]|nr:CoA transferase [Pseudomonadota bacterium]